MLGRTLVCIAALFAATTVGIAGQAAHGAPPADCLGHLGAIDLERATIPQLQAALTAGTITSVQLVDAYVARIAGYDQRTSPRLDSIRAINPTARAQAAALDAERRAGHGRGPLHGIPVLLKDNIGTTDVATTAGSIALAQNIPRHDATLTARLRAAGAVILGKTNLSEFANWVAFGMPNGYSSLGGQVVDAYTFGDPSGSSSGSGVAASMAFAAAAIGSETSGSILGPSNNNSLVGIKPTVGLVSRAGVIPLASSFDTAGPMARNVVDAALVLGAVAGSDAHDPASASADLHVPVDHDYTAGLRTDALRGVRLGFEPFVSTENFARARADLVRLGATLVPLPTTLATDAFNIAEITAIPNEFKAGINQYLATEAGPDTRAHSLDDIIAINKAHPDQVKYGQDLLIASNLTPGIASLGVVQSAPLIAAARAVIRTALRSRNVDAIVSPGLGTFAVGATAGYPTVMVPAGYDGHAPEGLSFLGSRWSEARLLAYAYAYEQGSQRRVPPTVINDKLVPAACGH